MHLDLMTASDPAAGRILREPPGAGTGYWAGAPGIYQDPGDQSYYLSYRLRRPRGVEPDRGGEARIARSQDLVSFEDIWWVRKEAYGTASIERSCLGRTGDGTWHYFTSYVDPADGRWCVARISGEDVTRLDPGRAVRVFSAPALGLEGIKDPWLSGSLRYVDLLVQHGKTQLFYELARADGGHDLRLVTLPQRSS